MTNLKRRKFEVLENRFCLAVTAMVTDGGDLIVEGDADGAVKIVAVSEGTFRVTDNGVVIADETTLQGVTDDIRIRLDTDAEDNNDVVTIDLAGQSVDRVYANLGDGDNSFELTGGTAHGLVYRGGDDNDGVALGGTIESRALVSLGDGDNDLMVTGEVGSLAVCGGDGADMVAIAATAILSRSVSTKLGGGDNSFTHNGTIEGRLLVSARDGADTVSVAEGATIGGTAKIALGDGDNSTTVAGTIDGNLAYHGGDGNDSVTLAETASIADSFHARLGEGDNSVTHAGTVGGDFRVVSANADDTVDITDTAVIGGETDLGLGEQHEGRGRCRGGNGGLESLVFNGRQLGFFFRRTRR
jgi:hypothetical protein